jgi:hypothetical protein
MFIGFTGNINMQNIGSIYESDGGFAGASVGPGAYFVGFAGILLAAAGLAGCQRQASKTAEVRVAAPVSDVERITALVMTGAISRQEAASLLVHPTIGS